MSCSHHACITLPGKTPTIWPISGPFFTPLHHFSRLYLQRSDDDDSTRSGLTPSNSQTSRATSAVPEDTGDEADSGASPRAGHHGRRHHSQHRDAMEAFTPVHMAVQWSLLSRQRIGFLDQSGLVTLLCIVVAATNFRLILENMIKYGLRFNPILFVRAALTPSENLALGLCWPALVGFCLNALFIEKLANRCLTAQLRVSRGCRYWDSLLVVLCFTLVVFLMASIHPSRAFCMQSLCS